MKLKLILPFLFLSSLAFGQGSFASFTVQTPTGNAIAGASVALCTSQPNASTPCGNSTLQNTYVDITAAVQCTKNALVLGPLNGAGCTNPGYTDNFGNAQIFALGGFNFYQAWGYGIANTYVSPLPFPALTAGIGTINNVTAINGLTGGGIGPTVTLGLITSCSPNNVLLWNGSTWNCSTAGTGTLTGATTAGTSGLIGGGLTGTLALSIRTDCASTQTVVWSGTSWNCGANGTGTVTGVTATSGGGLVAGGTLTAPTLGLITSCGNNQVLSWNGASWVCTTVGGGGGTPGGSNTQVQVNNSGAFAGYPFFTVNSGTSTVNMANGSVSNQFTVAGPHFINSTWPSTPPGFCAFGVGSCPSTTSFGFDQAGHLAELGFNNLAGGGEYLLSNPAASQTITQAVGTKFAVNNISNIRYITPSFNWLQSPVGSLTATVPATVTLTPCPSGVSGTDTNLWVYVSGTGTPEAVLTANTGSCTPGAASGTIVFTPANSHAAGFTVGSATAGTYEALRDGTPTNNNNVRLIFPPTNPPASVYYTFYAPVTVLGGNVDIDGNGATIDSQAKRAAFVMPTQNGGPVRIHGFRVSSRTTYAPATITQTACAANVATITSTLNPAVNEYVDVQGTFNNHFWGIHKVVTTSGSNWTYTDTNCGGVGSYSAQTTVGGNAYEWAFVDTNTTLTEVYDLDLSAPSGFSPAFNSMIVVLNDQAFHIHDIDFASNLGGCTSAYCSNFVYAPGPFSLNASVIYADHINGTLNCSGNGFTLYSGNTAHLSDVVTQGFTQWALVTGPIRGGFGPTTLTNVYNEVGGCVNPIYPGSGLQQKAMAGVISWGRISIRGGEAPIGNLPLFANTGDGGTQYNYYLITKDTGGSNFGPSAPLLCGQANVDSVAPAGSITVACPRINGPIGGADVITYDILRTTGVGNGITHPNGSNCGGGSTTACGSVLTAQAQCSTAICSFTDNAASNTTAYVVATATYYPYISFWPGAMALLSGADTGNIISAASARASVEDLNFITNVSPIISEVQTVPMVYSPACVVSTPGVFVSCLSGDSIGNSNKAVIGTLLQNGPATGGQTANLKGRLNFVVPGSVINGDVLTIVDSQPAKTVASPFFRPTADASDTAVCTDNGVASLNAALLCLRAPVAISNYINSLPDGTSWLERLTASLKTFKVPILHSTTTAAAQFLALKNTTAAVVGTSQGSPALATCGRAFHGGADVEDCLTISELPGNGNDAAITYTVGHTGTSTGVVTTAFPGPVTSGGTTVTLTIGSGTSTSNGTAIGAGTSQAQPAITITGATTSDVATCSLNASPVATWQTGIGLLWVVTSNTVTPWLTNGTAGSITPAATAIRCTVTR